MSPDGRGTKAAAHYRLELAGGQEVVTRLRLRSADAAEPSPFGAAFETVFANRLAEAELCPGTEALARFNAAHR